MALPYVAEELLGLVDGKALTEMNQVSNLLQIFHCFNRMIQLVQNLSAIYNFPMTIITETARNSLSEYCLEKYRTKAMKMGIFLSNV